MISKRVESRITCAHCGEACSSTRLSIGDHIFCCEGCQSVYQLLQANDLCEYYSLNDHPGHSQLVTARTEKFAFLDLPEIQSKLIQYTDSERTHVTFYIPLMHCSSCLWLLENLHRLHRGILSSRVDFSKKEVFISYDTAALSLREVAEWLYRIGYEPHLASDQLTGAALQTPDRTRWYKIGIAGFCFGNIMMLSLPEYFAGEFGVDATLKSLFTTLIVVLSVPVITYAASEFFISAWKGLRKRYINIDAPIALALLITFGRSMYEIFSGTGPGYLDSMSGIVFFMLIGRWLQDKTHRTISFDRDYRSFFPIAATVIRNGKKSTTPIEKLAEQDCLEIHHGELIPADALLLDGSASIDYSFVTGESLPVPVAKQERRTYNSTCCKTCFTILSHATVE
jgi:Cu+-exporting ATPase